MVSDVVNLHSPYSAVAGAPVSPRNEVRRRKLTSELDPALKSAWFFNSP